jgi:hypothetical protein
MQQQQPNKTLMQDLLKLAKTAEQCMKESSEELTVLAEKLQQQSQMKQETLQK